MRNYTALFMYTVLAALVYPYIPVAGLIFAAAAGIFTVKIMETK